SIAFRNNSVGYIAGNDGTLLKTVDNGQSWETISLATTQDLFSLSLTSHSVYLLQGFADDYDYQGDWAYGFRADTMLYYTATGGWSQVYIGNEGPGMSTIRFKNDSTGYYIYGTTAMCDCCWAYLYKTEDAGQTWTEGFAHESTADPCAYNFGFSDITLIDTTGYVFQGTHILKLHGGALSVKSVSMHPFTL